MNEKVMKIKSVKWNGRVMDITHLGDKTGTKFAYQEAEVSEYGTEKVSKIEEINLTTYEIHKRGHSGQQQILRIFNPFEVLFEEEKTT